MVRKTQEMNEQRILGLSVRMKFSSRFACWKVQCGKWHLFSDREIESS